jgi:hypothetical protein
VKSLAYKSLLKISTQRYNIAFAQITPALKQKKADGWQD